MAKKCNDLVMDAALDYIAACDRLFVCSAEPSSYSDAATAVDLATETLTSGDFTKANGDTSGRKVTVAEQATITVDHTGTATHIALGKSGTSELTYVTTCTSQALTAGNTVTVPAWKVEIADPS